MRVAIRVDASRSIGTGHVRRTLALAEALRAAGSETVFVTRDLGIDSAAMIESAGFAVTDLPKPAEPFAYVGDVPHGGWAEIDAATDAAETVAALDNPDWIVVDHYAFDAQWHRSVGARTAVIDDLADRALAADLVIDHNYHPDHAAKYAGRTTARILGGPRFALLGPGYAHAPRYTPHDEVRSIGIFMGGVDADNVTTTVLDALDGFAGTIEVVTTSGNPHLATLRARDGIALSIDLPDLAAFFARHDLQVGAGGGASWERCCIGAPTLALAVAENQQEVIPHLASLGAVATCPLDCDAIHEAIATLIADPARRANLSATARTLVDGLGARRVALAMTTDAMTLRPATLADSATMHAWRNHPATRAVSRDDRDIAWADHATWLDRTLSDPARTLLIAQVGAIPVGVIRFDRLDHTRAEVSLYLDPALHGLGLGKTMLLRGAGHGASGLDIVAQVLEGNIGSERLFASAGYAPTGPGHWIKPAGESAPS